MEENSVFQKEPVQSEVDGKKPTHVPALVIGILSIVFGILFAIVGDVLGIIGIILSIVKKKAFNTKGALICSIIGLVLSIANHVVAALWLPQIMAQLGM